MKKLFTSIFLTLIIGSAFAQSLPVNYQAVIRDNGGVIISNQNVSVRFRIIENNPGGTVVYEETHAATTSDFGGVALKIGLGTAVSGDYSTINWGNDTHYLETAVDENGGTNYTVLGTTQFVAVPYAHYAAEAGNSFSGDYGDLTNSPTNVSVFTNDAGYITNEVDGDASNELQSLSISGNDLSISSGNTITLPAGGSSTWFSDSDSSLFYGQTNTIGSNGEFNLVMGSDNVVEPFVDHSTALGESIHLLGNNSFGSGMNHYLNGFMNVAFGFGDTIGQTESVFYQYAMGNDVQIDGTGNSSLNNIPGMGVGEDIVSYPGCFMLGHSITNNVGLYNYALGRNIEFATANATVIGIGEAENDPIVATQNRSFMVAFSPQIGANNDPAFFVGANSSSNTGFVGIGTDTPASKLTIENGDVYLPDSNNGVILTSPGGACFRITVDNIGTLQSTPITCP